MHTHIINIFIHIYTNPCIDINRKHIRDIRGKTGNKPDNNDEKTKSSEDNSFTELLVNVECFGF